MENFWTSDKVEALRTATTYEDVLKVSLRVLGQMKLRSDETRKEIIQICGPISTGGLGNVTENLKRFYLAIRNAKDKGFLIFDQMPLQEPITRIKNTGGMGQAGYDMRILQIIYLGIFESGYVGRYYFIPNWQSSCGACWERDTLTDLGQRIEDCPPDWLL